MKLYEIIQSCSWSTVLSTEILSQVYQVAGQLDGYAQVFAELQRTPPKSSEDSLELRAEVDDQGRQLASCDISTPGFNDEFGEVLCSLSCTPWDEWLGMEVRDLTGHRLTPPEVVAHCLYEMTFYGRFSGDGNALIDNMARKSIMEDRSRLRVYDAFISYASEDKEVAAKIVYYLQKEGYKVWFDDLDLEVGDSIRAGIDKGLSMANYGIVVLSKAYIGKQWTQYELV